MIGAHSRDLIIPPRHIGGGWLVQAMSDGAMLGETTLRLQDGEVTEVTGTVYALWAERFNDDPQMAAFVAEQRGPHGSKLEEIIGTAANRIDRQYKSESPFEKLVGQILRHETGAEVSFLPGVGYGISLMP